MQKYLVYLSQYGIVSLAVPLLGLYSKSFLHWGLRLTIGQQPHSPHHIVTQECVDLKRHVKGWGPGTKIQNNFLLVDLQMSSWR